MHCTIKAVRSGKYKLTSDGQLFNLETDIGEVNNVADQHPDIVRKLQNDLDKGSVDLGNDENCRPPGIVNDPQYLVSLPESKNQ